MESLIRSEIVSTEWLNENLSNANLKIVQVSFADDDTQFQKEHISGSVWWYWKSVLWHQTDRSFPEPEDLAKRLGAFGIDSETTVVLYGDPVQFGTYAYWVLRMCGHQKVCILDGGLKKWKAEGRPLTEERSEYEEIKNSSFDELDSLSVSRENVLQNLASPDRLLLDVRSFEEYNGERVMPPPGFDHGAERAGRIPGATHLYYGDLINKDDSFKQSDKLRSIIEPICGSSNEEKEIIIYCRLSHRATLVWFSMVFILGYSNVHVYDGSWTEWGSIVGFPIEK
mgnify:CR=1 FL=1